MIQDQGWQRRSSVGVSVDIERFSGVRTRNVRGAAAKAAIAAQKSSLLRQMIGL
jgi:hypothetical protein